MNVFSDIMLVMNEACVYSVVFVITHKNHMTKIMSLPSFVCIASFFVFTFACVG